MKQSQPKVEPALLDRIKLFAALTSDADAAKAFKATLAALGDRLPDDDRERIATGLPASARALLRSRSFRGSFGETEFFRRVQRRESVRIGFAREHAQAVCRAIAESLDEGTLRALDRALPAELAELFHVPAPFLASEPPVSTAGSRHILATGKPGSRHPLSESAPPSAHADSVARANPHGATKLSSARGLTQERENESLATGAPATRHTIAEAKD